MKKIITLLFIFNILFSESINIDEATNIARNFYESRNNSFNVESIIEVSNDDVIFMYLYNLSPKGFMIVSADNTAMPILAYSFENNFLYDDIPVQVEYLLDIYKDDIEVLINSADEPSEDILHLWELYSTPFTQNHTRNVSPLLACNWNQDSPWNDMCPEDQDGPGGNVYAGCVAISMVQIMYYWGYPEVGYGSHGYNPGGGYGYQYADFGNTTYEYNEMQNNFATEESQLLIYHAGVSVNMGYSPNGSGASVMGGSNSTYSAMKNYFIFDHSISRIYPEDYSTSQYRELLQSDLENNQPIIYVGYSNEGGHAWNIDGYEDDYFHSNFGWGGSNNGYYLLSAMNGFNSGQGALINIIPEELDEPHIVLTDTEYLESDGDGDNVVNPGETVNFYATIENYVPWNDANSVTMLLESLSEELVVLNESIYVGNLNAGEEYISSTPFELSISENAELGNHPMLLHIFSNDGEYIFDFEVSVNVSLFQSGFPYDTFDQVKTNPLIIDLDSDGDKDIIFADNMGFVYVVENDGTSTNSNFPYEIGDDVWGSIAAEDIDLDGDIEFVVVSESKYIYIFDKNGLENAYFSDSYLLGTPAIGQIDSDPYFEIVVGGFNPGSESTNKLFVINHDATNVSGFPLLIGENIKSGIALADFDSNGYDDIVLGTESGNLYLILDSGFISNGFPVNLGGKIRTEPSVILDEGNRYILVGSKNDNFYTINSEGEILFSIETDGDICTAPSFLNTQLGVIIFFASKDGYIYAIDLDGNTFPGWPTNVSGDTIGSVVFGDLDGDGTDEVIASVGSQILIFNQDGSEFIYDSITHELPLSSAPTIIDLNQDGNIEVVVGTGTNLSSIDFKFESNETLSWNMHRGDIQRTGSYVYTSNNQQGDVNQDTYLDILDVVIVVNFALGNSIPTSDEFYLSDMNFDGEIDILDIIQIVNLILN